MIKKYFNTNVQTACEMTDVSDADIIAMSNGEVTCITNNEEDVEKIDTTDNTLYSEKTFGKPGDGSLAMGHIKLPIPIVNPHYVRGKKPFLPTILKMDRETVEKICRGIIYINKETFETVEGTDIEKYEPFGNLITGGEAIEALLKKEGKSSDKIILRVLPVVPIDMRVHSDEELYLYSNDYLYRRMLRSIEKYNNYYKLTFMPKIVRESFTFEVLASASKLIMNGVYGDLELDYIYNPCESLDHYARQIKDLYDRTAKKSLPDDMIDVADAAGIDYDSFKDAMVDARKIRIEYDAKERECHEDEEEYIVSRENNILFTEYNLKFAEPKKVLDSEIQKLADAMFDRFFGEYEKYRDYFTGAAVDVVAEYVNYLIQVNGNEDPENFCVRRFFCYASDSVYEVMKNFSECRVQWCTHDTRHPYTYDVIGGF